MRKPAASDMGWIDGRLAPLTEAGITVDDPAFHSGVGVFENTGGPVVFALATHVATSPLADEWIGADDFDGDGIPDLISGRGPVLGGSGGVGPDHVEVLRGLGALAFEPQRTYVGLRLSGLADLDGDGDLDPFGETVTEGRRFDGPRDGTVRQRGAHVADLVTQLHRSGMRRHHFFHREIDVHRAVSLVPRPSASHTRSGAAYR